jgi:hypothetical protein
LGILDAPSLPSTKEPLAMRVLFRQPALPVFLALLSFMGLVFLACAPAPSASSPISSKISSSLQLQVNLRKTQIATPNPSVLAQMQAQGLNTANLSSQRIFIYLAQPLTPAQTSELASLGLTLYPNSWIPPVANQPAGFLLADMPVDKLEALAAKNYIVRLDTAETQSQPQVPGSFTPGPRQNTPQGSTP